MDDLIERLERIENKLDALAEERSIQEYYSTADIAQILGRAEFTVREWCRLGRVIAEKRECGRGSSLEWMVSREEFLRVQGEGLLPIQKPA